MTELIAKCGMNCARCPSFVENLHTSQDRERCSQGWATYIELRLSPEKLIACAGCQAPDEDNPPRYQNCYVRRCAVYTGAITCAHCAAFPCQDLPLVSLPADYRARLEAHLDSAIPEKDYLTFIEPYEGLKHLEELRATLAPDQIVPKAEVVATRAPIAEFPSDLPLSSQEIAACKHIHDLIARLQRAQADTYARQLLLKRRRPHSLGLLWVMALYGEIQKDGRRLALDGAQYGESKQCSWLVRKRDNSFHGAVRQAANLLGEYGLTFEFTPLEEGWSLALSFGKPAGGAAALSILKRYATLLSERHGEPQYAGSTRFRGQAFTLFSKADMSVLEA